MKYFTVDLNLCSVICGCGSNDLPRSLLFYGFCASWGVVVLKACLTIYVCPLVVDVNLCVVVCGCSPILNFVVTFWCRYWDTVVHVLACLVAMGYH